MGESELVEENAWNREACGRKTGKGGNEKLEGQLLNWFEHSEYSNQNPKSRIRLFRFFIRLYSGMSIVLNGPWPP